MAEGRGARHPSPRLISRLSSPSIFFRRILMIEELAAPLASLKDDIFAIWGRL
jgi:hypothetical protein